MTDDELDLSAGMVPHAQAVPTHPAGQVTAFDQDSGLPIVRRNAAKETAGPSTTLRSGRDDNSVEAGIDATRQ
jgi:hypothetical protein